MRLAPSWAEAHFTLGRARAAVGDLEGAAAAFRQALALEPSNADAAEELGIVSERLQAETGAFRCCICVIWSLFVVRRSLLVG